MKDLRIKTLVSSLLVGITAMIILFEIQRASADTLDIRAAQQHFLHPNTPVALSGYRLPFDRRQKSVITNGPNEDWHTGTSYEASDFSPRGWADVYSAKAGTVHIRGFYQNTWGNLVVVQHDDGLYTYYGHLASPGIVGVNTPVAQGQKIGVVGCTGNCTGTHLHFEARDGLSQNNPGTGDSREHSARRIRGIGWFPWHPNANSNSGYTIRVVSPHVPNNCVNNPSIVMEWLAHNQFTHTQTEKYSWSITQFHANATPAMTVNAEHGVYQGTQNFAVPTKPKRYFIHLRAYDATNNQWATEDEIAHQGPYKVGQGCPPNLPGNYKDDVPANELDDDDDP